MYSPYFFFNDVSICMIIAIIPKITRDANARPHIIHIGLNTHNHDHCINPSTFNTTKIIVNIFIVSIPDYMKLSSELI